MQAVSKKHFEVKLKWFGSKLSKTIFYASNVAKSFVFPVNRLNILFSKGCGNEKSIKRGFNFIRHNISFDSFTPENIDKSDLVVPLNIEDARILATLRDLLKNKLLPSSSIETIKICDDKILFIETLTKKGFGDHLPKVGVNLPFPFLLKKRITLGGDNSYLITDEGTRRKYTELITNEDYFCQEIIEGVKESATHILFKNGKIVDSLTVEYTFYNDKPINGKEAFMCSNIVKCSHLGLFTAILKSIDYQGICCFDYKLVNGQPKVFEINPRLGGSLSNYFSALLPSLVRMSLN
jgi:predicted ATP-grasp superfamily ATP-dependent carboligase